MRKSPEAEGRRWLSQAEEDLDSARLLLFNRKSAIDALGLASKVVGVVKNLMGAASD